MRCHTNDKRDGKKPLTFDHGAAVCYRLDYLDFTCEQFVFVPSCPVSVYRLVTLLVCC